METNKHIDQRLAESIRIALWDFREGILMEKIGFPSWKEWWEEIKKH